MSRHVFADETKDRDYLLIASVHTSDDLDELRTLVRRLVLPGQYRVNMKKEGESRKRLIAAAIVDAGVTATVYDAGRGYRDQLDARAACLARHPQTVKELIDADRKAHHVSDTGY